MMFEAIEGVRYYSKDGLVRSGRNGAAVAGGLGSVVAALLLSMSALADPPPQTCVAVPNAEDLALVDEGRWVIASSMPGGGLSVGGLYAIDAESTAVHRAYPLESMSDHGGTAECASPVTPEAFSPHGIAVQTLSSGVETLFVVNHGERESIEIFEVASDELLGLEWVGCIPLPDGVLANAVAVTPDYRVYVSVMDMPEEATTEPSLMGGVLEWSAAQGWNAVPDSRVVAPNGLLVADDGAEVYVASWAVGELIKLTRAEGSEQAWSREALAMPFLPDNLRWGEDGDILVTGLRATADDVAHCFLADGPCGVSIPTGIASVRADEFDIRCSRNLALEMGTSTIPVGDALWVGPVRGDKIWVIGGAPEDWDQCE